MEIRNRHFCIGCMQELHNKEVCSYCGLEQKSYTPVPRCMIPGTKLAERYVLGKVLGEGSFGITYIGWDELLTIPVAIKEYYPSDLVSRDVLRGNGEEVYLYAGLEKKEYDKKLDKFLDEARNLTRFNHLNAIVSVRDFFYANNTAYIVMDYIRGESLKAFIKRNGAMNGKEVLQIFRPVLESLEKMHVTGILHRDISPDNLLFDEGRNLVLIDFGSAELQNADLTRSITINFKRGFSPEEQYRTHGKQGPWTDIYALCTSMYYAMTGVVPDEAIQRTIEDRVKPLWQYKNIELTHEQMKAIMKGMAVQSKSRFQNVTQLYYQLYQESAVTATPVKKNGLYYVCGFLIVCAIILGIRHMYGHPYDMVEGTDDAIVSAPTVYFTEMIDCVGVSKEKAKLRLDELTEIEFQITWQEQYSDNIFEGIVMKQSIQVGEALEEGKTHELVLTISKGKKVSTTSAMEDTEEITTESVTEAETTVQSNTSVNRTEKTTKNNQLQLDGFIP